jgi:uncharacterized flavoprotein (TIGR03862 family)
MSASDRVLVIGSGPAGLFAAERISAHGVPVVVHERMPSVARKFLMAGRGGLNLTHSEAFEAFIGRYGEKSEWMRRVIERFPPAALVAWAEGLGQETFTGSSGRVFPKAMKASPLLRSWLKRLEGQGVTIRTGSTWEGWDHEGALIVQGQDGARTLERPAACVLALGGASWPRLGSNAAWVPFLAARGVKVHAFRSSNAGFDVAWSDLFRGRFSGTPLQGAAYHFQGHGIRGESVITSYGLEGGAIYALSAALRTAIEADGMATLAIDLRPGMSLAEVRQRLARPRGGDSMTNHLRKALHLAPVGINLLRECFGAALAQDPDVLATQVKHATLRLTGVQGLARAISSAGGIDVGELDDGLMLRKLPGVFVAGEMIDWEAPTGGYLLQACFATGLAAAEGVLSRGIFKSR